MARTRKRELLGRVGSCIVVIPLTGCANVKHLLNNTLNMINRRPFYHKLAFLIFKWAR